MTTAQPAGDPHAGHETPAGKPLDPHAGHSAEPTAAPADPHAGHAAPAEPPEAQPDPHAGHEMTAKPAQADSHARSEEHTSELQSLMRISYAVFCLNKQKKNYQSTNKK